MLVALGWLRLEEPRGNVTDALWILLLALLPALAPTLALRLSLSVPAALTAAWVALDTPSTDDRPGFFAPVLNRFGDGFLDFYDVTVPFSGIEQPRMHGVVLLAIFGFCLLLAHAAAARRPLPALLATIAGAGWPATLLPPAGSVVYGAVILAAALWVLAGLRTTRPVPALVAGMALVLVAAGTSTSPAVAKDGIVAWERWDPTGSSPAAVSVAYVWNANYGGIEFPKQKTTVLRIRGPKRGYYWRATTLDTFTADRWIENLGYLGEGPLQGLLPPDPLLPARADDPATWVEQEVEVVALAESRLIAAATPRSVDAASVGNVALFSGGVLRRAAVLPRGQTYTVRSFAPRPKPADLARIPAAYPAELDYFLDLGRTRVDRFGVPGRDARVDALFTDGRYAPLWPYRKLWEEARRLRAGARTPYGAVVAIEAWLRSTGGFVYDEQPPGAGGLPPLAYFVAESKRGYCQQFAGAMALMLRFLGIPARVAAGFTSGTYEDGAWNVTDRNAHTWVDAWFPGYGWLPFDPTPGRGSLAGSYSASSSGFNARDAADAFGGAPGVAARGGGADQLRLLEQREQLEARRLAAKGSDDRALGTISLLVALTVGVGGAVGFAKLLRRRVRYLTRDPRRLAAATRSELVDFLADQRVAVDASATADELRRRVRSELGIDAQRFALALAEARFGPPNASAAAAARARGELRAVVRALRSSLGPWARLRGLVALRSLRG